MRKIMIPLTLALVQGACASAQDMPMTAPATLAQRIEAIPRGIARADGPPSVLARAAAALAVDTCMANGARVTALVVDSMGEPVAMAAGDGASYRSQLIAVTKARLALVYHRPSLDTQHMAEADPALAAQIAADADIGVARGGGYPVLRGETQIGAIAVSGALHQSGLDERCAEAGLALLEAGI